MGIAELRLQADRGLGRAAGALELRGRVLSFTRCPAKIDFRFRQGKSCPRLRKARVKCGRALQSLTRLTDLAETLLIQQGDPAEIAVIRFRVLRWHIRDGLSFAPGKMCSQRTGDFFRDLAFDREDVGQLAIIRLGPDVRIVIALIS